MPVLVEVGDGHYLRRHHSKIQSRLQLAACAPGVVPPIYQIWTVPLTGSGHTTSGNPSLLKSQISHDFPHYGWIDFSSSGLPHGGPTQKEKFFMTTKIWQWQRIALLAGCIATSMASMAWGQELYQTHTDGSIWKSTGIPCSRGSCPGWIELDNNPNMYMIAAGGGALFEMHFDGSIWWYVGPACSGGSCPGWVELDNNKAAYLIWHPRETGAKIITFRIRTQSSSSSRVKAKWKCRPSGNVEMSPVTLACEQFILRLPVSGDGPNVELRHRSARARRKPSSRRNHFRHPCHPTTSSWYRALQGCRACRRITG